MRSGKFLSLAWSAGTPSMSTMREETTGSSSGGSGHAGLGLQQGSNAADLVVRDIDRGRRWEVGSRGDVQLFDDVLLDEIDGHDLHDAQAERGQQCGRGIARTIEIGEAVAQRGRQMQPGLR